MGPYSLVISGKTVLDYNISNLLDLVGLGLATPGLKIQNLFDILASEHMTGATNPLFEAEPHHQVAQVLKADIRIGGASQHGSSVLS
jgi:hypothetical protein